ncbi:putative cyclic nucleotide-gated ion channel 8 [Dichanthelium oligosanthes]|uniref:Putative cyclic nucleotide-gated ion channel 8 n=1 Tax=Dichanthelium oligosanthes TaxID=888268 RepID=A0A1E5WAG9_9POAL|nr:putative cyclic nucleotide-gated ion channel 8 [Dichanthelium oligosanthes]
MFDGAQKAQYMDGHREKFIRFSHIAHSVTPFLLYNEIRIAETDKFFCTAHACYNVHKLFFLWFPLYSVSKNYLELLSLHTISMFFVFNNQTFFKKLLNSIAIFIFRLEESSPRSSVPSEMGGRNTLGFSMPGIGYGSFSVLRSFLSGVRMGSGRLKSLGHSLASGAPKTAFAEDLKLYKKNMFDPQDKFLFRMNWIFFSSCIIAVAVDPLFLFLPIINNLNCIGLDKELAVASTIVRTVIDFVYLVRVFLQFRTAYVAPSSRVFGTGELVIDPMLIATRYFTRLFIVDFLALLPLPQIVVWRYLNSSDGPDVLVTKNALVWVVLIQYIPRFLRIFPLTTDLKRTAGVFIETAWAGAAYYLLWFMLAGHNVGTLWYFLTIKREGDCWRMYCDPKQACDSRYLYCKDDHNGNYSDWLQSTEIFTQCNGTQPIGIFNFGIYQQALVSGILGPGNFIAKICYCFWWGLQNLSTLGQGLLTSTYPGEVLFSIFICVLGLILFALLIVAIRLEEMRVKKRDAEQWMHHRSLPPDIRHRVPLFENMDERLLDAICERLRPALYTENEFILREGDPVDEMHFILHGCLESVTTDGGRSGFFNKVQLKEAAWRRYHKRKMAEQRRKEEEAANRPSSSHPSLGATIYASRFAANAMRGVHRLRSKAAPAIVRLPKPPEPDFGVDDAD